jgi:hypothetical protein
MFGVHGFILVDTDTNAEIPRDLECNPITFCFGSAMNFSIQATAASYLEAIMLKVSLTSWTYL